MAPVYRLSHEEFLKRLSIRVDEGLTGHKQAFMLDILVILSINVISNNKKCAILKIAEAIIEEKLCSVSKHIVRVFT
jgi:hypothetical protein